jgi:hypothetical protein
VLSFSEELNCAAKSGGPNPNITNGPPEYQNHFAAVSVYVAGCEGRISMRKCRDGLSRYRYRDMDGIKHWVGWGVVGKNLRLLTKSPTAARSTDTS